MMRREDFPDLGLDTHRTGFTAGVDVGLPVSNALEVRVGGAYVQKGLSVEESVGRVDLEMDYLQLSALARVGTSREGPLSLGVLLGPWAEGGGAGKHRNLGVQAGVVIPFGG
ncbi:hypothetical protein [Candidatus Palauibacter sp.]|uniref:hypothetical protein n=1 Tax=Candidatus Palauibacter sp. TaxID=3101350 RepID=UPI003AF2C668